MPALKNRLLLNEIVSNPRLVDWDGQGSPLQAQWIELLNPEDTAVEASLWQLSTGGLTMVFPNGTVVPPHGFLVLFQRDSGLRVLDGATVRLSDSYGNPSDSVQVPALPADQSYARIPDGTPSWTSDPYPTLGSPNTLTPPLPGNNLQATVQALQTQIAQELPEPTGPAGEDQMLDATEAEASLRPKRARLQENFVTLSIGSIRSLPDGTPVRTAGTVTLPPGRFDSSRGYLQADGRGILIHLYKGSPRLQPGELVAITGRVHRYRGEVEIAEIKGGVKIVRQGPEVLPRAVALVKVGPETEAILVQVSGAVSRRSGEEVSLSDGNRSVSVLLYRSLGVTAGQFELGRGMTVAGVVNAAPRSDSALGLLGFAQVMTTLPGHRLVPRSSADIRGVLLSPAGTAAARQRSPGVPTVQASSPPTVEALTPGGQTPSPFVTPRYSADSEGLFTPAATMPVVASASAASSEARTREEGGGWIVGLAGGVALAVAAATSLRRLRRPRPRGDA